MIRKPIFTLVALIMLFALGACSAGNPYMKRGSKQFEEVTTLLLGEWTIASYSMKGDEKIGGTYKGGKVVFDEPESGERHGTAQFTLPLSAETIKTMSAEWKKKWPELQVEKYDVVAVAEWELSKDGKILFLQDPLISADISGKGKDINALIGWENGKLQSSSVAQAGSGRRGFVVGKIVAQTSGVRTYYPELPTQSRLKLTENKLDTTSNFRINLAMSR